MAITATLELTRFSQAFLLLKAREVGVEVAWVPAFLMLMSAVYGLSAFRCGILADHVNRRWQLCAGVIVLVAGHLVLAIAGTVWLSAFGIDYFVDGVASLLASSGAGILWSMGGVSITFQNRSRQ